MNFTLNMVDLSGLEQEIARYEDLNGALADRDHRRDTADRRSQHFRVLDDEGREREWDEDA